MPQNAERSSFFPAIEKKHGQPMSYWFELMSEISNLKYPEQMAYLQENHGFSRAHANALILYCKGNTSSRRFNTLDEYLADADAVKQKTVRSIFKAITDAVKGSQVVIAWNKPMVKLGEEYLFGVTYATNHLLLAPWSTEVLNAFKPRLTDFEVKQKTFAVPVDWKVDKQLLVDMVNARLAELG